MQMTNSITVILLFTASRSSRISSKQYLNYLDEDFNEIPEK